VKQGSPNETQRLRDIANISSVYRNNSWLFPLFSAMALSYPLIFLKAKMQLTIGVSARRLSYDES
jgi:hypothetical protein